jgi:hypothetical protein
LNEVRGITQGLHRNALGVGGVVVGCEEDTPLSRFAYQPVLEGSQPLWEIVLHPFFFFLP